MDQVLFGFANSMFQASHVKDCGESNWTKAMENNSVTQSDVKISHWKNFKEDITEMKSKFGVSTYRVSIEWSQIEPQKNVYDFDALSKYKEIINYCISLNIKPMLTLHHFNEPLWFSKLGGFENDENIDHFVDFCKFVYSELNKSVYLWCTINEPAVYAFMGYLLGGFPPHVRSLNRTLIVLKNLLIAHTKVYHELKTINSLCQIGIVHNVLIFKQLYLLDLVSLGLTKFFNTITNDLVIEYFMTGNYKYIAWLMGINIEYYNPDAKSSNDFIGLNFYANPVVGPNMTNLYGATCRSDQEMGDMYLPLDKNGFSDALDLVAKFGLPIYVTEIGIADSSDELRGKFVNQYLHVVNDKLKNGMNIMGCYFWTFRDNYEWNQINKQFGFYTLEGQQKQSCTILRQHILAGWLEYENCYNHEELNPSEIKHLANIIDVSEQNKPSDDTERNIVEI